MSRKYTTKITHGQRYGVYCDGELAISFRDSGSADKVAFLLGVMYTEAYDEGYKDGMEDGRLEACGYAPIHGRDDEEDRR